MPAGFAEKTAGISPASVCERPPAAFGGSPLTRGSKRNLPLVRGRRERSERGGRSHIIFSDCFGPPTTYLRAIYSCCQLHDTMRVSFGPISRQSCALLFSEEPIYE